MGCKSCDGYSNLLCFQVAEEAVEAVEPELVKEQELPNFTKVCSLSLSEVGLPPRMFTAGNNAFPIKSILYGIAYHFYKIPFFGTHCIIISSAVKSA